MKANQKKLQEFMYLSLLGEFRYSERREKETLVCFSGTLPLCSYITKPICITSSKNCTDTITELRVTKFENEVLKDSSRRHRNALKEEEKLNLNKRIKLFVEEFHNNDAIFIKYNSNLEYLRNNELIDKNQCKGAIEYVSKERKNASEKIF